MRKMITALVAATILAVGMPGMAAEQAASNKAGGEQTPQKAEAIQEKIARLQKEVAKGASTYSAEELYKLESKLKDAEDLFYVMTHGN